MPKKDSELWSKFYRIHYASKCQLQNHMTTKKYKKILKDIGIEGFLSLANTMSFFESDLNPLLLIRSGDSLDNRKIITALKKKIDIPYNMK
jgi:hypothetical protein